MELNQDFKEFIELLNLRTNKASTGRAKDLGDLENLFD